MGEIGGLGMGALDQIVDVVITQNTSTVPQASFSIPLIAGPSAHITGPVQYFSSPAGYLSAGGLIGDPEYTQLVEAFSQALTPEQVGVGTYTPSVAQVDTFQVNTLTTGHAYQFTLNGMVIGYTSLGGDAQQDILNNLLTAIGTQFPTNPPVSGVVTGTGAGALLTLTSTVPGAAVTYTAIDASLTYAAVTPNHSIVQDLLTILAVPNLGNLWYGLSICSQVSTDIEQVAAFIETQLKIFIGAPTDAAILTTSTTDVASVLKDKGYARTALLYAGTANDGRAAAWLGGQLPQVPGSNTWDLKTLVGISPDSFNDTQRAIAIGLPLIPGKNCNIYETVGGVNITENGFMVGGQYIDITVGLDWLRATLQTNVFALMVQSAKIPYTNQGIAVIENAVHQTLLQGVANGLIDGNSPITVTAPDVLDIPQADRAARLLPDVKFSCRLAGAIQNVIINGTVSV